jgi:single-stranded-DNA-specific exonuclease
MNWIKKEIDKQQVKQFAARFNINTLAASIFLRRGITRAEDLLFYLEDDLRFLHNPFHFPDMEKVIERVNRAVKQGEKISVYGDRDVDGITSTVLIVDCLRSLGAEVEWNVPMGDDDYGLSFPDIDKVVEQGAVLLVTVDCGISNHKEVEYAFSKGIETIIIDHHNPQGELPGAFAVINPKCVEAGYPFRDLAGCGVVFKVDWALHFAKSEFYNREYCVLLVMPAHDSYSIECISLRNLVETGRFRESIVPGVVPLEKSGLFRFVAGRRVMVYNRDEQQKLLEKAFPGQAQAMELTDLRPDVQKRFPEFTNKSLLYIREHGSFSRYAAASPGEIEVLKTLFSIAALEKAESEMCKCLKRLDLVTLGTIADMMPLVNENRIIVKRGLALMNTFERQGLRELLLKKNRHGKDISTWDIAWQISPLINASGRLGEPDKAIQLLLTSVEEEKQNLVEYLFSLNKKRKNMSDAVWEKILREAHASYDRTGGKGILIVSRTIHRGITGIIATRLVNTFKAPAVIITELPNRAVGSMRSIPGFKLQALLLEFESLFSDYGGHDFAAGFSMPLENIERFRELFYPVLEKVVLPEPAEERLDIDAEIPCTYLKPELFSIVRMFQPFGEGNPALLFLTKGVSVESCEVVGKKEQVHLKLLLNTGSFRFPAMIWNGVDLYKQRFNIGDKVDIVYRMRVNYFMNTETLQLIIQDIYRHNEKNILAS